MQWMLTSGQSMAEELIVCPIAERSGGAGTEGACQAEIAMSVAMALKKDSRAAGRESSSMIHFFKRALKGDELARGIVFTCAAGIIAITVLLVYELWTKSSLSMATSGWGFVTGRTWDPIAGEFGALPFIYGTVVTSILALLFAIPVGVGAAVFLAELAPSRLSDPMTFLIELLAAVPSVIIGLIGIFVLVPALNTVVPALKSVLGFLPIFSGPFYGVSVFSAGVVLSIMIVPFIISISREVLLAVPRDQREAALALGCYKMGIDLASGHSLCADRDYRLHLSGSRPGAGRNNGRDDGYRQYS